MVCMLVLGQIHFSHLKDIKNKLMNVRMVFFILLTENLTSTFIVTLLTCFCEIRSITIYIYTRLIKKFKIQKVSRD